MDYAFYQLVEDLAPILASGDTQECERRVSRALLALPTSPFHIAVDLPITNSPLQIANHFDGFFKEVTSSFQIGAVYTEMNGFDINPDRWYFDVFAYEKYGGEDYEDWISDWQSGYYQDLTITGLESLQKVYEGPAFRDKAHREARDMASLLVVTKFQDLIRRSVPFMNHLSFPLLATAHDYDFIYEARPLSAS